MKATYSQYLLNFKQASGTSRGVLRTKETWFLLVKDNEKTGIGECGLFRGLSIDDKPNYEAKLQWVCKNINQELSFLLKELSEFPSIQFGLEQAFLSLQSKNPYQLFSSNFSNGNDVIPINNRLCNEISRFYFVHSYAFKPLDEELVIGTANYGIDIISIIKNENIIGAQFHPEKSSSSGEVLLKNFLEM